MNYALLRPHIEWPVAVQEIGAWYGRGGSMGATRHPRNAIRAVGRATQSTIKKLPNRAEPDTMPRGLSGGSAMAAVHVDRPGAWVGEKAPSLNLFKTDAKLGKILAIAVGNVALTILTPGIYSFW